MRKLIFSIIYIVLSNISFGQTAQMVKDAQSIQKLLSDLSTAWNIHDARELSMVFSEDANYTDVRGLSAHGRKEIEKFQEKLFATSFKNSKLTITDKKISFITADITSVDAWWEMTGAKSADGKDIPTQKGLMSFIMTRGDETWYVTVMHNMNLPGTE